MKQNPASEKRLKLRKKQEERYARLEEEENCKFKKKRRAQEEKMKRRVLLEDVKPGRIIYRVPWLHRNLTTWWARMRRWGFSRMWPSASSIFSLFHPISPNYQQHRRYVKETISRFMIRDVVGIWQSWVNPTKRAVEHLLIIYNQSCTLLIRRVHFSLL